MYSPEFYLSATPEEVKKAIGGKSLANESYTERYYASNTEGSGFLAGLEESMNNVATVFIPLSSVDEKAPVYPLQVAVGITPYPEVITLLLDAGADPGTVNVPNFAAYGRGKTEIKKILISRSSPDVRCRSLMELARAGNVEMMEYCLDGIGVSPVCTVGDSYPLKEAIRGGQATAAACLSSRGAALPERVEERLEFLAVALRAKSPYTFNWLIGMGFDCSLTGHDGKNGLMRAAYSGNLSDETALAYLAGNVPVDAVNIGNALYYAYGMKTRAPMEILLKRVKRFPQKNAEMLQVLESVLSQGDGEMFWRLVAKGADCSAVGEYGENRLLEKASRYLPDDAKITEYLVRHAPWRETGVRASPPRL